MIDPAWSSERLSDELAACVAEPRAWVGVLDRLARSAGSEGAILLPGDTPAVDVPFSPGIAGLAEAFFRDGWYLRDLRARGAPLTTRGRVISDEDVATPEEIRRSDYYNAFLRAHGFGWFCAVGFIAGETGWGLSFQRTVRQGPFDVAEKRAVAALRPAFTQAATLSELVGRRALEGVLDGLSLIGRAAFAIDARGGVVARNEAGDGLLGRDLAIRSRRLHPADAHARAELNESIRRSLASRDGADLPAPTIARDESGAPKLAMRLASIPRALAAPFLGARLVCVVTPLDRRGEDLSQSFLVRSLGLTPAEARLLVLLGRERDLRASAVKAGISYETARNHLKRMFHKTGTGRQADLLEILARLHDT